MRTQVVPVLLAVAGGIVLLGSFFGWFRGRVESANVEFRFEPWDDRESVYEFIRRHTDPKTRRLTDEGQTLPDEPDPDDGDLQFAAGAMDGVLGHHGGGGPAKKKAEELRKAIKRAAEKRSLGSIRSLNQQLADSSAIDCVDLMLDAFVEKRDVQPDRLLALAKWLARESPDRDTVKIAMSLLGLASDDEALEILRVLARHEEFTLYAAVAFSNSVKDPDAELWELARAVDGWGRVQTIERLKDTANPAIRDWLIREGYENSVMIEYTALICAETGDLIGVLRGEPDEQQLRGAGWILEALLTGDDGPAEGMNDYSDGVEAMRLFLNHLPGRTPKLDSLVVVSAIEGFLRDDERGGSVRGLTPGGRRELQEQCAAIIADESWNPLVDLGLAAAGEMEFRLATSAAQALGRDVWEVLFERLLARRGEDIGLWYQVCQTEDPARMERVVRFAEESLPLDAIATGPGEEMGLGPEFGYHSMLDFVLQELRRFPGEGWVLIRTGLASPVIRNRYMALYAIGSWGEGKWGPEVRLVLESARAAEPDDDVRERMDEVLTGEVLALPR